MPENDAHTSAPRDQGLSNAGLHQAALRLVSELELEPLLQEVVEQARLVTGARYAALGVVGPSGRLSQFLTSGMSEEERSRIDRLPEGRGILGLLIHERVALRLPDLKLHPASAGFPQGHPPMSSFLGVPIQSHGTAFGNLYLTDKQGADEFSAEDEELVTALAAFAAVAIHNAQLVRERNDNVAELKVQNKYLASLTKLGQAASESLEVEDIISEIIRTVQSTTRAEAVEVWLHEPEETLLRLSGPYEATESLFFHETALDMDNVAMRDAVRHGQRTFGDIEAGPSPFRPTLYDQGFRTYCVMPLIAHATLIGVLLAAYRAPTASLTDHERTFIDSLASVGAPMLENALLHRQVRQRGEEARALLEVSKGVVRSLRLEEVLSTIVHETASLLGAEKAHLFILDHATNRLKLGASFGYESDVLERAAIPLGMGHLGRVADQGQPLVSQDVRKATGVLRHILDDEGVLSCAHTPIQIAGEIYGVLTVNFTRPNAVSPSALPLLQGMADQAAIAIHNAELYRQSAEERNALNSMFQSMGEGIYTVDRDLRVLRANPKAATMANTTARSMLGVACRQCFPYMDETHRLICDTACPAKQAILTGEVTPPREVFLPQPDGRLLAVDLSAGPLRDQSGDIIGAVEVVQDVSHRYAAEQLREDIMSLVSHELRTPLGHIKGYASSLLQTDVEWDEEITTEFLHGIVQETTRMARLIDDILELSRMESGRKAGEDRQPISIASPARAGVARTKPFTEHHRMRLSLPQNLPPVLANAAQIEHVISNLVENAAKYSPAGTQITVSARATKSEVVVTVADQGYGIPADKREAVFEKFVRLPSPDGKPIPGTGLGLPLCRTIVEGHGGHIWVDSIPGQGSRFSFTLPRADVSR